MWHGIVRHTEPGAPRVTGCPQTALIFSFQLLQDQRAAEADPLKHEQLRRVAHSCCSPDWAGRAAWRKSAGRVGQASSSRGLAGAVPLPWGQGGLFIWACKMVWILQEL